MPRPRARTWPLPTALALAVAFLVVVPVAEPLLPGPVGTAVRPLAAPAALAAEDGYDIRTSARYVVQPARGVIRVRVDVRATNQQPNTTSNGVVTRYYFDGVNLGVQPDAVRVRATQDGARLPISVSDRSGYRLVRIDFLASIYFGETADVRLSFDLPGGRPRSDSDVRVGAAFATFVAWAFGDRGSVRIELPPGFTVDASGEDIERSGGEDGGIVLTANPADPPAWYAWVNARNDGDLARERLDIEGGEEIIVRGWPEDPRWRTRVANLLTDGVPELVDLIGLPWPVRGPLEVIEVHTPLLEGYAGFYDIDVDEITISEDLDNLTIIHEASHAWFNLDLFPERWINEGLADEYAARVLGRLGRDVPDPDPVRRDDKVAFPLDDWPPPAAIEDEDAARRERYGYDASWIVLRRVVDLVGEDGMRRVFASTADGTTAYQGDDPTEASAGPNDWRRFLDRAEELGGVEGIDDILREWALTADEAGPLDARDQVRNAYHALLDEGNGWAAPRAIRASMDRWAFAEARVQIAQASTVLDVRDGTAELASSLGLDLPHGLEAAYEDAATDLAISAAASLAADERASLDEISAASEAAAEPRDWITELGLDGKTPDSDLDAAGRLWASGELDAATARADGVVAVLMAAPEVGRQKLLTIGIGSGAVLVTVLLVGVLVVRRRRRDGPGTPAPAPTAPTGIDDASQAVPRTPIDGQPMTDDRSSSGRDG